jgi:hypothetical protein
MKFPKGREQGKRLRTRPLPDPSVCGVLEMKAKGQSVRAIVEPVRVSKSFVHKTYKK